jgi:hypothetical protein
LSLTLTENFLFKKKTIPNNYCHLRKWLAIPWLQESRICYSEITMVWPAPVWSGLKVDLGIGSNLSKTYAFKLYRVGNPIKVRQWVDIWIKGV